MPPHHSQIVPTVHRVLVCPPTSHVMHVHRADIRAQYCIHLNRVLIVRWVDIRPCPLHLLPAMTVWAVTMRPILVPATVCPVLPAPSSRALAVTNVTYVLSAPINQTQVQRTACTVRLRRQS